MPALHHHTPTLSVADPRGLPAQSVAYLRSVAGEQARKCVNRTAHNVAGRAIAQWDPRLYNLHMDDPTVPPNLATVYSLSGHVLSTQSVDAGLRVQLFGESGQGVYFQDGRGTQREVEFDALLRPLAVFEQGLCTERFTYSGADPVSASHNQCGQIIRHDDPAGTRHFNEYAMGGAVLDQVQHFLQALDTPDWPIPAQQRDDLLEPGAGARTVSYVNAQGEVLQQTDAAGNHQGSHYSVDGQLREAWLQLKGSPTRKVLVSAITSDAHGKTERKTLGNGVVSQFEYCPQDGRLLRLYSHRGGVERLQDLHYGYDPVGNIVSIEDTTLAVRFFANQRIDPISWFWYDSLYQLIKATGYEAGSASKGPNQQADPRAVANFRQTYHFDLGGNLLELIHHGPQNHGRVLKAARYSNRCLPERDGVPPTEAEIAAAFDANGNLLELELGRRLHWDQRNQLAQVRPVERQSALDDTERYIYGADGMRRRKVRTAQTNARAVISETRYLPGLEIRNVYGDELQLITVGAVQVLHWATAPPKRMGNDQLRYTLENHLGSCALELDADARVVSRESYHPFGSTAFWERGDSSEETYRTLGYSGKERDATGLYYYGFRYYIAWLQRWVNPDSNGNIDGFNLYRMVRNNPIVWIDKEGKQATRKVFDEKDVEGMSSIFATIKSGLEKNGLDPHQTLFILVGRSPLVLGAYIEKSGFQIANLQISGMAGGVEVSPLDALGDEEKANRLNFLEQSFGAKSIGMQSVVVIDEGISGSSAFSATGLVKEYFESKNSSVVTKMATISQRINDSRYDEHEQRFLHHESNLLYETPLDKTQRGVRRYIKIGTAQVDKGLAYVEKFDYLGMDSGKTPSGIDVQKKAQLDLMMSDALQEYGINPEPVRAKKVGNFGAGNASVKKYNKKNSPSFLRTLFTAFTDTKFGMYKAYG